jgi:hypothetical protein
MTISQNITLEKEFFGQKSIIIAKSGYGKSYTARVIIEEGRKLGNSFVVIDPQDAYLNLPDFDYIDIRNVKNIKTMALLVAKSHKNIVIQVKGLGILEQNKFLKSFLEEYRLKLDKGIQTIVIDEMHKYAPETEKTECKEIIRGMFQENRSDGLGIIGISQRVSRIDKTCLSQADNLCIGRVTSFRDKEAIKNYIDEPEDIEKIKNLEKGEFYFYGFDSDSPVIEKVRESESKHSGDSPQNLLNENILLYSRNRKSFYKGDKKMSETISNGTGVVGQFLPSKEGFMNLASLGAKMSLGLATAGLVGVYVGSKFTSPIPVISSRTLGGAASTVVLYTGYRMIPEGMIKDIAKYATAGSTVFTVGSLLGDLIIASKIQVPNIVNFVLTTATGAAPLQEAKNSESGSEVDLNTSMA